MIRGIVFDCFGVLCHGSLDYLRSITPPEHLQDLNELSLRSDYGYISRSDYSEQVATLIGRPAVEIDALTLHERIRNDHVIKIARSLHHEFKVGLLSNVGRGVIDELFSQNELDELFDAVVLSSEVGMVKPNKEIYDLMALQLGLLPEECVMIDDLAINVDGAEKAGMKGILYASGKQLEAELKLLVGYGNA